MFKNYLKTAWRNLIRQKVYSFINITGLAIGLAVCMLIMLYVGHEKSYDRFHVNADRICWIGGKIKMGDDSILMQKMSYATGPLARQNDPAVESFVRLYKSYPNAVIENKQNPSLKFVENKFLFADSNFFNFFSFKLLSGNRNEVLRNPFSVVISKQSARKYFGNINPVGKIIRYNNSYDFTITGVTDKTPSNSSIEFDFVASLSSMSSMTEEKHMINSQFVRLGAFNTYFLLRSPRDFTGLANNVNKLHKALSQGETTGETFYATPMTDTHLNANLADSPNIKYLRAFPVIAGLVLLLALINYMSLSTARATLRAKEVGVRKAMGAVRRVITMQFFIESTLYITIAFAAGYILCAVFQPLFFNFLKINIDHTFLHNPHTLLSFFALFILTALLAAAYPSFLLSTYKPAMVIYGKLSSQRGGAAVRRFFTVFQFSISVSLIICGIVIGRQIYFFRHMDTGINRENIVMIPFASTIGKHFTAFKEETKSLAQVEQVATAHYPMYKGYDAFFVKIKNSDSQIPLPILTVDENFIPMLGLKWKMQPADSLFYLHKQTAVLNETAMKRLALGNRPLNQTINLGNQPVRVAGVLKDFNYESLENKIGPLCISVNQDTSAYWGATEGCLFVKIKSRSNVPGVISRIEGIYNKYDKSNPFDYYFMDDAYDALYKAENRLAKILNVFIILTMLIACLGLYGLAAFTASQRTKEIGIRKVLGASIGNIAALLSRDFMKLVIVAIVIASPLAWFFTNKWLENFAYRIHISWWIFFVAGSLAVLLALITVSYQAIKAAAANPVNSLRTE